jgi:REP element-mobilizing transposase RayT
MSSAALFIHAIWLTSRRARLIDATVETAILDAIRRKCLELRCPAIAVGAADDHVHLLARVHRVVAVARLIGEAKGLSSYLMSRQIAPGRPFRWHKGYWARSVHPRDVASIAEYVANQRAHHQTRCLIPVLEPQDDET